MGLGHVSVGGTAASSRFPEFNSGDMSAQSDDFLPRTE